MEKIGTAADRYGFSVYSGTGIPEFRYIAERAFNEGADFINQWISIEQELPEDSDNLTQTEKYIYTENPVLVRTINGKYSVSKRSKFKVNENSKWEWIGSTSFSDSISHWRPIEFK